MVDRPKLLEGTKQFYLYYITWNNFFTANSIAVKLSLSTKYDCLVKISQNFLS